MNRKFIITKFDHRILTTVLENEEVVELHCMKEEEQSMALGNIYVGKVENIASNIQAAFVKFGEEQNGYLPLSEASNMIFSCDRKGNETLRAGDEVLVQVSRDAMKGKGKVVVPLR